MRLPTRRKRQEALAAAFDAGIHHFDVAPMYGLGAAEAELGRFARRRRDRIVIATKFGIEPSSPSLLARIQGPARALLARYPALRRAVKRRDHAFHQPRDYEPANARASLERSLRELGTDHVDLFLLHDPPDPGEALTDELGEFLESARTRGDIRAWGIAGETASPPDILSVTGDDAVAQVQDDIFARDPGVGGASGIAAPRITFGILAEALPRIVDLAGGSDDLREGWRQRVGADCSDPGVVAELLIRDALEANPEGTVLFSTTKPEHIAPIAAAADSGDDAIVARFRAAVGDAAAVASED